MATKRGRGGRGDRGGAKTNYLGAGMRGPSGSGPPCLVGPGPCRPGYRVPVSVALRVQPLASRRSRFEWLDGPAHGGAHV